jgi:hypothetical protein
VGDHDLLSDGSLQFFLQESDEPAEHNDCHNIDTCFHLQISVIDERIQNVGLIFG